VVETVVAPATAAVRQPPLPELHADLNRKRIPSDLELHADL